MSVTHQLRADVEHELQRLWETTTDTAGMICDRVNAAFGTNVKPDKLGWKAKREGWTRHALAAKFANHHAREERLLLRSLLRDRRPRDNPVRLVKSGTHPAKGFGWGVDGFIKKIA